MKVKCPACSTTINVPAAGPAAPPPPPSRQTSKPAPSASEEESPEDGRYTLDEFLRRSAERDHGQGLFELESERLLEVNLDGMVWTKMGSMVAYVGDVKFTREGILEHGIGKFLKKAITGEGARLTKAEGEGKVYLADMGKKVTILELHDESIFVNANDVLAFEGSIEHDIKMMRKITGMLAGGLFNMKLSGTGMIAITTHYDPLTLRVSPGQPVCTDPNATVAWSGNLSPGFKADVSLKTFFGRGSGESIQMLFEGDGFVVVQPYEEAYFQATR
ncbi:MAG: AIM24 family protein [Planctomycetota bacterium]|nr:MAG: AIM24 family protein [Planctomycetota bacterium]